MAAYDPANPDAVPDDFFVAVFHRSMVESNIPNGYSALPYDEYVDDVKRAREEVMRLSQHYLSERLVYLDGLYSWRQAVQTEYALYKVSGHNPLFKVRVTNGSERGCGE